MASLQEFLEVLADAYPDEQVRGKEFEPFLRDALLASPSHQFADVWLWDDWPGRDGPDRGIDLVAAYRKRLFGLGLGVCNAGTGADCWNSRDDATPITPRSRESRGR